METYTPTDRTQVRRMPKRGVYDKAQVCAILDEGFVCHAGFVVDGQPYVIPTGYGRAGDLIYIHGSSASRMLRTLDRGVDLCVTVTLVDGFVLARSAFHHSMNYRSVVVLGRARLVTGREEKMEALRSITNHIVPGRWEEARLPTDQELKATTVLALRSKRFPRKFAPAAPSMKKKTTRCLSGPVWSQCGSVCALPSRTIVCCRGLRRSLWIVLRALHESDQNASPRVGTRLAGVRAPHRYNGRRNTKRAPRFCPESIHMSPP